MATLTLTGASGTKYSFDVYPDGQSLPAIAGVYYVSLREPKQSDGYSHHKVYIGESKNVADRLAGHEKENCFETHKANCVSVHAESNAQSRVNKEADLIASYEPPCND